MITIFSSELDHSTSKVIEWIDRLTDMKVVRINYDRNDDVVFSGLISNDYPNRLVGKNANEIKSIWFRKNLNFSLEKTDTNDSSLKTHLSEENMAFNQGLASLAELSDCKVLGTSESEFSLVVNKVSALLKAKKCGFLIPQTLVTNDFEELESFVNKYENVIIKAISEPIFIRKGSERFTLYTAKLSRDDVKFFEGVSSPVLVQAEIQKSFELRIFYLNGICYSGAIFSQFHAKSALDLRNHDSKFKPRIIPYKTSEALTERINSFMRNYKLNTGSLDLIITPLNEEYFLEVNPLGQFDMLSVACNYPIEKEIAKFLTDES